jgi:hypothetical protein
MQTERQIRRIIVDIPVIVTSVLESCEAILCDLSEHGAQVTGCAIPAGMPFQIEYMGQTVFAQCRWAEVDRMGCRFLFPLKDGPLHKRLLVARDALVADEGQPVLARQSANDSGRLGARTFGQSPFLAQFGRRH